MPNINMANKKLLYQQKTKKGSCFWSIGGASEKDKKKIVKFSKPKENLMTFGNVVCSPLFGYGEISLQPFSKANSLILSITLMASNVSLTS